MRLLVLCTSDLSTQLNWGKTKWGILACLIQHIYLWAWSVHIIEACHVTDFCSVYWVNSCDYTTMYSTYISFNNWGQRWSLGLKWVGILKWVHKVSEWMVGVSRAKETYLKG